MIVGGNGLSEKDISCLKNKGLQALICYNNPFNVEDVIDLPFASTLKKLAIGKNIRLYPQNSSYQKLNLNLVCENFSALTHLKLKGFKGLKPDFLELMNRLICLTVIETQTTDIQVCHKYCNNNSISFN